jgi:hypothetical protein
MQPQRSTSSLFVLLFVCSQPRHGTKMMRRQNKHTLHFACILDDMHLRAGWHVLPPMQHSTRRTQQHTNTVQKPLSEPIQTHIHTDQQQQEASCIAVAPAPLLASHNVHRPAQAPRTPPQAKKASINRSGGQVWHSCSSCSPSLRPVAPKRQHAGLPKEHKAYILPS